MSSAICTSLLYVAVVTLAGVPAKDVARHLVFLGLAVAFGALTLYRTERSERLEFLARQQLARERLKSDALLLNILPGAIAERLKAAGHPIADDHPEVSVLFADLVGFTPLSARLPAAEVVALLNRIFSEFDGIADRHGLEKIKTIGDAYMAASGLPSPRTDHAAAVARAACEMIAAVARVRQERDLDIEVRVGLHAGGVVAGVIGKRKFSYDLWGDTVNLAAQTLNHRLFSGRGGSRASAARG